MSLKITEQSTNQRNKFSNIICVSSNTESNLFFTLLLVNQRNVGCRESELELQFNVESTNLDSKRVLT